MLEARLRGRLRALEAPVVIKHALWPSGAVAVLRSSSSRGPAVVQAAAPLAAEANGPHVGGHDPRCRQIENTMPLSQREGNCDEGAWCSEVKRSGSFALLLNELGLWGTAVEVGVWRGTHAALFLSRWLKPSSPKIGRLYLVDPYTPRGAIIASNKTAAANVTSQELHEAFSYARRSLRASDLEGRHTWIREASPHAGRHFADASLDFVFIDGAHNYHDVKADIRGWHPKVRRGGILAGHDLTGTFGQSVRRALDEFSATIRHPYCSVDMRGTASWYMVVP